MFENIVVGTDGSPTAEKAVERAIGLAKAFGAALHVISAYQTSAASFAAPELMTAVTQLESAAKDVAQEALDKARADADAAGVRAHTYTAKGDPADAICRVAEDNKADLIVVGSRGMSGAARFLLGSVPNRVSHHATCSVLIVNTAS